MPNSIPSNLPNKYNPEEKPKASSLNSIGNSIKSASSNKPSLGFQSTSQSFGNSNTVHENLLRPPIWAMITNINRIVIPADYYEVANSYFNNISNCYGYYKDNRVYTQAQEMFAYSWVQVEEDLQIGRNASTKTPYANDIFAVPGSFVPKSENLVSQPTCYRVAPIVNTGKLYGTLRKTPAYCVNQLRSVPFIGPGKIVKLYFGTGDYMLFTARLKTFDAAQNHDYEQPWLPDRDHP